MCFDSNSEPPILRIAGAAVSHDDVTLTSADGTDFAAFLATPDDDATTGVVILPDVRGLYRFYVELAERFAQAGHHAIAIDYFGRTAGTGERSNDWEYMPHVMQTRVEQVQADTAAAIAALRERTGASSIVTVGFCFGGTQSFLAGTSPELMLDGVVGFYGRLSGGRAGMPSVLDHAGEMRCPVLGLFGGADEAIPPSEVDTFDRLLDEAGVEHEIVIYPDAPHSFFDRKYEEHAGACSDAWRRVISFLEKVGAARAA
jgi:carboxymethylenebutenolidase